MESKDCIESNQQEAEDHGSEELVEAGVFTPPLYKQRYSLVADILRQEGVKSVADFGIAECKVMMYLKGIESLESITGVDIDADLLERFRFLIHPLTTDYLQPRDKPLLIQLLAGNVAQCDHRLADVEAVTMIELVEHLESNTLETFPENVFGFIAPRLVVITTPNSEYNVLFPNFSGFRHWDHKFEWTRAEFQEWCQSVASRYYYSVTYTGVGFGGKGTEHLGHCSQIAVFTKEERNGENVKEEEGGKPTTETMSYKLVAESRHPCKQDRGWSAEEEILHEAQYYINMLVNDHRQDQLAPDYVIESDDECENSDLLSIPLEKLLCFHKMKQKCEDPQKLGEILEQHGSRLSEDRLSVLVSVDMDDDDKDDMDFEDESRSSDCTDNQATERNEHNNFRTLETEDWDEEEDRSEPMYGKYTYKHAYRSHSDFQKDGENVTMDSWKDQVLVDENQVWSRRSEFDETYCNSNEVVEFGQFLDAYADALVISTRLCEEEVVSDSRSNHDHTSVIEETRTIGGDSRTCNTTQGLSNKIAIAAVESNTSKLLKRYQTKFVYAGEKLYSNPAQNNVTNNMYMCSSNTGITDHQQIVSGDGVSFRRTNQIQQPQQQEWQITEDPVTVMTADSVVIHQGYNYYNFPALRLDFVMRCLVCGGKTKQLHHRKSLMSGINDVCRCVWTQQGAEEFRTAVTISSHTGAEEGQFSDAEDEF